jgi:hypothetical protein
VKRFSSLLLLALAGVASAVEGEVTKETPRVQRRALHVDVDALFVYSGLETGLGALVRVALYGPVWNTRGATGTLDGGLEVGYQNHPVTLLYPPGSAETVSGGGHRVNLWLTLGHTLHMTRSRRLSLGLHALVGWTRSIVDGALANSRENVGGRFTTTHDVLATGLQVKLAVRVTRHVGVALYATGFPFKYEWADTGYFSAGLGLTAALR